MTDQLFLGVFFLTTAYCVVLSSDNSTSWSLNKIFQHHFFTPYPWLSLRDNLPRLVPIASKRPHLSKNTLYCCSVTCIALQSRLLARFLNLFHTVIHLRNVCTKSCNNMSPARYDDKETMSIYTVTITTGRERILFHALWLSSGSSKLNQGRYNESHWYRCWRLRER